MVLVSIRTGARPVPPPPPRGPGALPVPSLCPRIRDVVEFFLDRKFIILHIPREITAPATLTSPMGTSTATRPGRRPRSPTPIATCVAIECHRLFSHRVLMRRGGYRESGNARPDTPCWRGIESGSSRYYRKIRLHQPREDAACRSWGITPLPASWATPCGRSVGAGADSSGMRLAREAMMVSLRRISSVRTVVHR